MAKRQKKLFLYILFNRGKMDWLIGLHNDPCLKWESNTTIKRMKIPINKDQLRRLWAGGMHISPNALEEVMQQIGKFIMNDFYRWKDER